MKPTTSTAKLTRLLNLPIISTMSMSEKRQETLDLLQKYALKPTRSLGQNFLVDDRVAACALQAVAASPDELVIEIGPGLGSLTRALAARAGRLIAIEIDRHLLPALDEVLAPYSQASVIHADALKTDLTALAAGWSGPVKVAANLPYYITTPLLEKVLSELPFCHSLTLMLQKEAAARLSAQPGSRLYGPLAIQIALYGSVKKVARVPAAAFYPQPHVDSLLIQVENKHSDPCPAGPAWLAFLQACFARRRKTLLNSLSDAGFSDLQRRQVSQDLQQLGLPQGCRPEQLTPDEYSKLFQLVLSGQDN